MEFMFDDIESVRLTLLQHPSITLLDNQVKFRLELGVKVMLISLEHTPHERQSTHRVLDRIRSILGDFMVDNSLRDTVRGRCICHQLGVASTI